MPLQNRVQPTGEIIAHPARGSFMGNRGILHGKDQRLGPARWRHKAWVTCLLDFKGRQRRVMAPRRYTELFFHDEAVAFAAGHRPCAECRRAAYTRFREAAGIRGRITDFDALLHGARVALRPTRQRRFTCAIRDLPAGCFILEEDGTPLLIWQDRLMPFTPAGYGAPRAFDKTTAVTVLTPAPLVAVLRAGYKLTPPSGV